MSTESTFSLSDIGLTQNESTRWQTIAATPEEEFDQFIGESIAGRKELTSKAAYRLGDCQWTANAVDCGRSN